MMKKILSMILAIMLLSSVISPALAQAETKTATIKYLTEAIYDSIGTYSEGLVWVKQGDTYKYLDESGKVVIDLSKKKYTPIKYTYIFSVGDFHEGLALINVQEEGFGDSYDPNYGYYIDTKGNIVLKADQIEKKPSGSPNISPTEIGGFFRPFSGGVTVTDTRPLDGNVLVVTKDGKAKWYWGSINDYFWFTEDLLCYGYYNTDDYSFKWGYVDKNFKKVISYKYDDARPFNQGLAPVKTNGKWGFIDKKGKTVIKAQFEDFVVLDSSYSYKVFNDGLAVVQKGGKWGAIDKTGKTIIAFKYAEPFMFCNGYAVVADKDGNSIYIDKKGKTAFNNKYDDANYFSKSGVALVGNKGVYKLINTKGKQIGTKTWKFDRTSISGMTPDILKYKIGDKWGIAKIK